MAEGAPVSGALVVSGNASSVTLTEWTAIARSDEATVTREECFMVTIAQPALRKRALTFTISYIFG
ncbi:MAG: hypothetical protein V4693_18155 [Pseudomonadota bacterium]